MDRGEAHAGRLPHVDRALLCQVHVVEVDELKLGLFLWPEHKIKEHKNDSKQSINKQPAAFVPFGLHNPLYFAQPVISGAKHPANTLY